MLDQAFEALKTYDWGAERSVLDPINEAAIASRSDANARKELETRLAAVLKTNVSRDAKDFVCRKLMQIGSAISVHVARWGRCFAIHGAGKHLNCQTYFVAKSKFISLGFVSLVISSSYPLVSALWYFLGTWLLTGLPSMLGSCSQHSIYILYLPGITPSFGSNVVVRYRPSAPEWPFAGRIGKPSADSFGIVSC